MGFGGARHQNIRNPPGRVQLEPIEATSESARAQDKCSSLRSSKGWRIPIANMGDRLNEMIDTLKRKRSVKA